MVPPSWNNPVEETNVWGQYRDPTYTLRSEETVNQIRQGTRPQFDQRPNPPVPPLAQRIAAAYVPAPPPAATSPDALAFMAENKPHLPGNAAHWKGTKFLGEGGNAMVGLWEYTNPNDPNDKYPALAVKQSTLHPDNTLRSYDMHVEAELMGILNLCGSDHITQMYGAARALEANDPSAVFTTRGGPDLLGKVARIYMCYCTLGDLHTLIKYRKTTNTPFLEITLWKMFECFVDGCLVMHSGSENVRRNEAGDISYSNRIVLSEGKQPFDWYPIVHLDIKPQNILLETFDPKHPDVPVCKIGDFGMAEYEPEIRNFSDQTKRLMRSYGTHGYLAPEQFTDAWDYKDWKDTGIAGLYDTPTNIWGIGCLMYALIVLEEDGTPAPSRPFVPSHMLRGHPKGRAYGDDLQNHVPPYSRALIELVWECLYEKPGHRPTLIELKERIVEGWRLARTQPDIPTAEPWSNFQVPEPTAVQIAQANADAGVARGFAQGLARQLAPVIEPFKAHGRANGAKGGDEEPPLKLRLRAKGVNAAQGAGIQGAKAAKTPKPPKPPKPAKPPRRGKGKQTAVDADDQNLSAPTSPPNVSGEVLRNKIKLNVRKERKAQREGVQGTNIAQAAKPPNPGKPGKPRKPGKPPKRKHKAVEDTDESDPAIEDDPAPAPRPKRAKRGDPKAILHPGLP